MAKVIVTADQKGGVGKSTTSNFIAYELALKKYRVLLIDWDSQASQTNSFFGIKDVDYTGDNQSNIVNMFNGKSVKPLKISDGINKASFDFIPSNEELLETIEGDALNYKGKLLVLTDYIKTVEKNYDYILIDCPPSFGILTKSALLVADVLLVPIATKSVDEDGIKRFFQKSNSLYANYANMLKSIFVLPTLYDSRMNNAKEMLTIIRLLPRYLENGNLDFFKNIPVEVLEAIPYKVEILEAPAQRMFLREYVETYIASNQSKSINAIITILESITAKIIK